MVNETWHLITDEASRVSQYFITVIPIFISLLDFTHGTPF